MRILIVTWGWPPIGRIGSMRPLGMAREWVEAGCEVHVLTGPGDRGGEYTPDLEERARRSGAVVHRAAAPGMPPLPVLRPAYEKDVAALVQRPVSRGRQILAQWRTFPGYERSWISEARELGLRLQAEHRFDVVWSTSPPESAHYVSRALAAAVPWVADFRDQWSEYLLARWDPLSRWVIDGITRRLLSTATRVTANTLGVAASIRRACRREVRCVRNGFDPMPLRTGPVRERTIGYFGRVDPRMQRPDRLWPVLRSLRERGRPWRVEFYLSPGGGGGASIRVPADLVDLVALSPPLPHGEALCRMQEMTALLVLAWETRGGESTVAGKLFEYVGSGRPTLVCAPRGFEARELVETTGTGIGGWDEGELVDAFSRLEWVSVDPGGRESLSRGKAARELLELLEQSAHAGPGRRVG